MRLSCFPPKRIRYLKLPSFFFSGLSIARSLWYALPHLSWGKHFILAPTNSDFLGAKFRIRKGPSCIMGVWQYGNCTWFVLLAKENKDSNVGEGRFSKLHVLSVDIAKYGRIQKVNMLVCLWWCLECWPNCYSHTWEFCVPDVHILRLYAVIYVFIILRNANDIYKQQLSINGCMRTSNLLD